MKTGIFSLRARTYSPATWSECSCEMMTADRFRAWSPVRFIRRPISRQDTPASTKMRVRVLARTLQFPRLPLAKTVSDTMWRE